MRVPRAKRLPAAPVELRDVQRVELDAVEAAHIDGDVVAAVAALAAREGLDAARGAEEVVDGVLIEFVVGERVLAGEQRELRRGHEREQRAAAAAHRAVAGDDGPGQIDRYPVADLAAVTAALVGIRLGLRFAHARNVAAWTVEGRRFQSRSRNASGVAISRAPPVASGPGGTALLRSTRTLP